MIYDYQTSTPDGAEAFARMHSEPAFPMNMYDEPDHDELDDEQEECNCSDPGCPCGGNKIGGL